MSWIVETRVDGNHHLLLEFIAPLIGGVAESVAATTLFKGVIARA